MAADLDVIYSLEDLEGESNFNNNSRFDVLDGEQVDELTADLSNINLNSTAYNLNMHDPVIIKGTGNLTLFGLNNRFDTKFPSTLTAKVAPEEYASTIKRINLVLKKTMTMNARWLVCCSLVCCCSLGCSLWPVICMNKRTINQVEKILDYENNRLYHRLNLNWKLHKLKSDDTSMTEVVLLLEFIPKVSLFIPD
ncbi:hypothetical protein HELRODRAFT_109002 [Helobdella robusta]|uniref:Golgin subfamily A member 7/ERF4 domain-containing protein n=1 Tax=Helobdella robusta TaxID=6412 RepID=T1EEP8_HELRO|nr:hypothetical protein HELRODRAFT_109002 [Helobdella robusta]ESO10602.1 hypothetical protein HELRODRAFT_109002 [Helobdella robusta]